MERIIFHCDLNSFYASVELLDHPELRHLPVAVCGDPESRHGIILAKNEPAKKFQVKTAETIWQAKRKCPDLVLLPAHHSVYRDYSKKINRMYRTTPTWWSPSASTRAGWTCRAPSTCSGETPWPWPTRSAAGCARSSA